MSLRHSVTDTTRADSLTSTDRPAPVASPPLPPIEGLVLSPGDFGNEQAISCILATSIFHDEGDNFEAGHMAKMARMARRASMSTGQSKDGGAPSTAQDATGSASGGAEPVCEHNPDARCDKDAVPESELAHWVKFFDASTGRFYYANAETEEWTWEAPSRGSLVDASPAVSHRRLGADASEAYRRLFAAVMVQLAWRRYLRRQQAKQQRIALRTLSRDVYSLQVLDSDLAGASRKKAARPIPAAGDLTSGRPTSRANLLMRMGVQVAREHRNKNMLRERRTDGEERSVIGALQEALRRSQSIGHRHDVRSPSLQPADDMFDAQSADSFRDVQFTEHAPEVFRLLRRRFGVDEGKFEDSIKSIEVMEQNAGRSGSFFYITSDKQYILKTITSAECELLRHLLKSYYAHVAANENTLLSRYLGLFQIRMQSVGKLILIAMTNIFCHGTPHEAYDLKGSTVNRTVLKEGVELTPGMVLKDNDLTQRNRRLYLPRSVALILLMQLSADSQWLMEHDVMDYSLLLGVHWVSRNDPSLPQAKSNNGTAEYSAEREDTSDTQGESTDIQLQNGGRRTTTSRRMTFVDSILTPFRRKNEDLCEPARSNRGSARKDLIPLPKDSDTLHQMQEKTLHSNNRDSRAARVVSSTEVDFTKEQAGVSIFQQFEGGIAGHTCDGTFNGELYYIGIVDMLQTYTIQKKMERNLKRVAGKKADGISSMNSESYRERMMNFLRGIIIDPSVEVDARQGK